MILDDERQRELLLQLIESQTIPGTAVEEVYFLRRSIVTAVAGESGDLRRDNSGEVADLIKEDHHDPYSKQE